MEQVAPSIPTLIRDILFLPASGVGRETASVLVDITGRKVMKLVPGPNDVRFLATGVYFIRSGSSAETRRVVIAQ